MGLTNTVIKTQENNKRERGNDQTEMGDSQRNGRHC